MDAEVAGGVFVPVAPDTVVPAARVAVEVRTAASDDADVSVAAVKGIGVF